MIYTGSLLQTTLPKIAISATGPLMGFLLFLTPAYPNISRENCNWKWSCPSKVNFVQDVHAHAFLKKMWVDLNDLNGFAIVVGKVILILAKY